MAVATPADQQKLKEMIKSFFGVANMSPPQQLQINDEVATVFMTMLQEAGKCTDTFVLVPHPLGGRTTVIWMANNVTRTIYDTFSKNLSTACVVTTIRNWKTSLYNASMEI